MAGEDEAGEVDEGLDGVVAGSRMDDGDDNGSTSAMPAMQAAQYQHEAAAQSEEDAVSQVTEEFGPDDQEVMNILGSVMDFESDAVKEIFRQSVQDKDKFVKMYKAVMEKQKAKDDIRIAERLEEKFKEIDREMKKLFVVGDYSQHYRPHERAIIYLAGQFSESLAASATGKFNSSVSHRRAINVMADLESEVKKYETKVDESKKKEIVYKRQIAGLETSIRNDNFALRILLTAIGKTEDALNSMYNEEARYLSGNDKVSAEKIADRREEVSRDYEKMMEQRDTLSNNINMNSAIFHRKEVAHKIAAFSRKECQYAYNAAMSHHEILGNMLDDYKNGIPISIRDGRILIKDVRERDDAMGMIDMKYLKALQEATATPRNVTGLQPHIIGNEMNELDVIGKKAGEQSCQMACKNADEILNRRYKSIAG